MSKNLDADSDLVAEQVRLTKARADKLELELKEKARSLIGISEVERLWEGVTTTVKTRLLAIPSAVAPTLALLSEPADVQEHLARAIEDALSELSRGAIS